MGGGGGGGWRCLECFDKNFVEALHMYIEIHVNLVALYEQVSELLFKLYIGSKASSWLCYIMSTLLNED